MHPADGTRDVQSERPVDRRRLTAPLVVLTAGAIALGLGYRLGAIGQTRGPAAVEGAMFALFGLATMIIGAFAGRVFWASRRQERAMLARSAGARGQITGVREVGVGGDATHAFHVTVRYDAGEGEIEHETANWGRTRPAVGTDVRVRYDPADPSHVLLEAEATRPNRARQLTVGAFIVVGMVVLAWGVWRFVSAPQDAAVPARPAHPRGDDPAGNRRVGIAVLLIGVFGVVSAGRKLPRARRASAAFTASLERSIEVTGTVIQLDRAIERQRAVPTFAFRTAEGEERTARSLTGRDRRREIQALAVGTTHRVRYDPKQPEWLTLADVELARVRRTMLGTPRSDLVISLIAIAGGLLLLFL